MDMETQSSSSSSGPIQVRLEDVNCHEASQALAKLLGYSFFCDLNFAGSVSLRGAFESRLSGRSWWRRGKNKCLKASESVMPW